MYLVDCKLGLPPHVQEGNRSMALGRDRDAPQAIRMFWSGYIPLDELSELTLHLLSV